MLSKRKFYLFYQFDFLLGNILYHNVTGLIANEKYLYVVLATNHYGAGAESVPLIYDTAVGKLKEKIIKFFSNDI